MFVGQVGYAPTPVMFQTTASTKLASPPLIVTSIGMYVFVHSISQSVLYGTFNVNKQYLARLQGLEPCAEVLETPAAT